jgi:hypothetical protein
MTLEEILAGLSLTEREQVTTKLQSLARHCALTLQAVHNLNTETRLTEECWRLLVRSLAGAADPNAQQQAITVAFQKHTLTGPEVPASSFGILGRAVTVRAFVHLLVKLGYYGSYESAHRALLNKLRRSLTVTKRGWGHFEIGRFLLWSTFNSDSIVGRPFDGFSGSADEIRGLLGLDRNDRFEPLLLFEYTLPATEIARYPTVAEAYSGDSWSYFFRPAPPTASYGLTMPWPEYEKRIPRPEIVHRVLKVSELVEPLRRIS